MRADLARMAMETAQPQVLQDDQLQDDQGKAIGRPQLALQLHALVLVVLFPIFVALLILLQRLKLIANQPIWVLPALLAAAVVVNELLLVFSGGSSRLQIQIRTAAGGALCAVCMYATGWGPALLLGFLVFLGISATFSGFRATRAGLYWLPGIALVGQVAIEMDLAPSLIPVPEVHGLAAMAVLSTAFAIHFVAQSEKEAEEADQATLYSERRFRSLVQNTSDVIAVLDDSGCFQYVSPAASRVLGADPEGLMGQDLLGLVHPEDLAETRNLVLQAESAREEVHNGNLRLRHADGDWLWLDVRAGGLPESSVAGGIVVSLRDATEHKLLEEELAGLAFYDSVTGLPNRRWFADHFLQAASRADRHGSTAVVLFVDLDNFKSVNDRFGHQTGDGILRQSAERLRSCIRTEDDVARLGGDEFLVLVEDFTYPERAIRVAEQIVMAHCKPFVVDDHELIITASVGIASSRSAKSLEEVVHQADTSMYLAKAKGKSRFELFAPSVHAGEASAREVIGDDA